ncbi:serine O-acetyltransferase [Aquariibacter albus]|uniref:Serine acetyltransferase n=1 Tax=Aquariibacter albus TaxID=2759899 RepID=A0A839HN31_9BURK|nr:serine acetyltransferase [Aquariibacter albus]MBB1160401.1 serine acetyltransferase [Aquariibacter albus]
MLVPDWSREACRPWDWAPSRQLLRALRAYQRAHPGPLGAPVRAWAAFRHRFWSVVTGADIPLNSCIDGGLMMLHPNGIVIHPGARIGPNAFLLQQVTLGTGPRPGLPVLGADVMVGAGAKVLGGVLLGDHCRVGANAVVVDDVPAGAVAVGIPARVLPPSADRYSDPTDGTQPPQTTAARSSRQDR